MRELDSGFARSLDSALLGPAKQVAALNAQLARIVEPWQAIFASVSAWEVSLTARMATLKAPWTLQDHPDQSMVGFAHLSRLSDAVHTKEPYSEPVEELIADELGAGVEAEQDDSPTSYDTAAPLQIAWPAGFRLTARPPRPVGRSLPVSPAPKRPKTAHTGRSPLPASKCKQSGWIGVCCAETRGRRYGTRLIFPDRHLRAQPDPGRHIHQLVDAEFADPVVDQLAHARTGDAEPLGRFRLRDALVSEVRLEGIHELRAELEVSRVFRTVRDRIPDAPVAVHLHGLSPLRNCARSALSRAFACSISCAGVFRDFFLNTGRT